LIRRSRQVGTTPPAAAADQRDQEQNDKDKEQDFRDLCGARGDSKEAKGACYQRDDQKNYSPA